MAGRNTGPTVGDIVREAVNRLGSPATNAAVYRWVREHYPDVNLGTVGAYLIAFCVNHPSRIHHPENQRPRASNNPRHDVLYRPARGRLETYQPQKHGRWAIVRDSTGRLAIQREGDAPIYPGRRPTRKTAEPRPPRKPPPPPAPSRPEAGFVPIRRVQIDAANRLAARVPGWQATEKAFAQIKARFPTWDREACQIKAAVINDLYSTRLFAVWRMADHLMEVMAAPPDEPIALVEAIAALPSPDGLVARHHMSFASKVCHFFLDADRFPVFDSYCREMVRLHLGRGRASARQGSPYRQFVEDLTALSRRSGLAAAFRELDRYLWLAGQHREWLRHGPRARVNSALRQLFEDPSDQVKDDLAELAPSF